MRLGEILDFVEKENHLNFIEYIQKGITVEDYMHHLEWCPQCKHAVWLAKQDHRGISRPSGIHGSQIDEKDNYKNDRL